MINESRKHSAAASRSSARVGAINPLVVVIIAIILLAVVWKLPFTQALVADMFPAEENPGDSKYVLHRAEVDPFRITITENGTIDSLQNSTIVNSVEGTTTIISLVPEGSQVNGPLVEVMSTRSKTI